MWLLHRQWRPRKWSLAFSEPGFDTRISSHELLYSTVKWMGNPFFGLYAKWLHVASVIFIILGHILPGILRILHYMHDSSMLYPIFQIFLLKFSAHVLRAWHCMQIAPKINVSGLWETQMLPSSATVSLHLTQIFLKISPIVLPTRWNRTNATFVIFCSTCRALDVVCRLALASWLSWCLYHWQE